MTLAPGVRYEGGPGTAYEVTGLAWGDGCHEFVHARKIFQNFRYPADSLDEAPAVEALDVLIRRPVGRPDASGFERETVLTLPGLHYFLEWIDLIDPPPGETNGPWFVFADPHVKPLDPSANLEIGARVGLAFEVLAMLDVLHRAGMVVGATMPGDFLPRGVGGWYFLGTDRIRPLGGKEDTRADLAYWAELTQVLMSVGAGGEWPALDQLPSELGRRSEWLSERVRACIHGRAEDRPSSVAELEQGPAGKIGPIAAILRLLAPPRGRA